MVYTTRSFLKTIDTSYNVSWCNLIKFWKIPSKLKKKFVFPFPYEMFLVMPLNFTEQIYIEVPISLIMYDFKIVDNNKLEDMNTTTFKN